MSWLIGCVVAMVERLKSVQDFLVKCQGSDDFKAVQQKQFDGMLNELRLLKTVPLEQASEMMDLIRAMVWTDDMKEALCKVVQGKASLSSTRVVLQHWTNCPLFLREEDWLRLTNVGLQSQAFTVNLKEMVDHLSFRSRFSAIFFLHVFVWT